MVDNVIEGYQTGIKSLGSIFNHVREIPGAAIWGDGTMETDPYLTFKRDDEIHALGISHVRKVLGFTKVSKVPRMPEWH